MSLQIGIIRTAEHTRHTDMERTRSGVVGVVDQNGSVGGIHELRTVDILQVARMEDHGALGAVLGLSTVDSHAGCTVDLKGRGDRLATRNGEMVGLVAIVVEDHDIVGIVLQEGMDTIHTVWTIAAALAGKLLDEVFAGERCGDLFRLLGFRLGFTSEERARRQGD